MESLVNHVAPLGVQAQDMDSRVMGGRRPGPERKGQRETSGH